MDDPVERFAMIARSYCAWAESPPLPEEVEVKTALRFLADLSSAIMATSHVSCGEDIDENRISDTEWKNIYDRFGSLPFNYYSSFFHPTRINEDESGTGDLADDLADIYRDIKNGLWLYDNRHTTEAVWSWRYTFQIHWGRHATSGLYALHTWSADGSLEL